MEIIEGILDWAWARHHNIWSWYIRPVFILPFCYFAWRRSLVGVFLTLFLTLTSIAWFPAPEVARPEVLRYLELERRWMSDPATALTMTALIGASLWFMAEAFWRRRLIYGVLVLNIATAAKVMFSLFLGGEDGKASILPSLITLAICNFVIFVVHYLRRQAQRTQKNENG